MSDFIVLAPQRPAGFAGARDAAPSGRVAVLAVACTVALSVLAWTGFLAIIGRVLG